MKTFWDKKYAPWVGKRFGYLTIISEPFYENKSRKIICRCDCGGIKTTRVAHLISGKTKSCGCYRKKVASDTKSKNKKLLLNYASEEKLQKLYRYFLRKQFSMILYDDFCDDVCKIFMEYRNE